MNLRPGNRTELLSLVFYALGGVVLRGQSLQYDATLNKYIVNALVNPRKLSIVADKDGTTDDVVAVSITRIA